MPFSPQNFVDQVGPPIKAAWLNELDQTVANVLQAATTVAQVQAILGVPVGLAFPITVGQGGTGSTTSGAALAALGGTTLAAVNVNNGSWSPFPQTAAELAASVTPTAQQVEPGDITRFGADPTGVVDSTTAITNALLANAGSSIHAPAGTYKCTAQILIPSNTLFYGDGMGVTTFAFNNPNGNQFITGTSKVTVRDFTVTVTGAGSVSEVCAINISNANYCRVSRVEVSGVTWVGVGIFLTSSHNIVEECYFHGWYAAANPIQGSADISISYNTGSCNYNIIRDNYCLGGGEVGISILGSTGSGTDCQYNLVTGNRIGAHTTYGILDYNSSGGNDWFNQIIDNYVENIQGTTRPGIGTALTSVTITGVAGQFACSPTTIVVGQQVIISGVFGGTGSITGYANPTTYVVSVTNGSTTFTLTTQAGAALTTTAGTPTGLTYTPLTSASGAGIYIAGATGDMIKGNVVRNCCVQTTFRSLVPAAIAFNGGTSGAVCNIIGNTVDGMTKWDGISVASSVNGANVVGNIIRMPTNTTGSAAINVAGSSNCVIANNGIDITPVTGATVDGIDINLTTSQSNIVISNNRITGGNSRGIYVLTGGAPTLTGATINGNIISGSGGGNNAIDVANLNAAVINGNNVNLTTNKALNIVACTQTRVGGGNVLITTGTTAVATSGTCTGSALDESNYLSSSAGVQLNAANNAGTGLNMRQLGAAAPTAGTQVLGDTVHSTTGVSPFAFWCTTAGSPGTFTGLTIP
jgi:Pectate lyase superfamily protein/Periplasmic copper-binding protein (NosD)